MAGWPQLCKGYELGQIFGDGEGQRGLACCSPWESQRVRCDQVTEQQQTNSLGIQHATSV